jgi:hypothetical protein
MTTGPGVFPRPRPAPGAYGVGGKEEGMGEGGKEGTGVGPGVASTHWRVLASNTKSVPL